MPTTSQAASAVPTKPQATSVGFRTVPQIATLLICKQEVVLKWIHAGLLRASDVSEHSAQRPRWRVSQQAPESFLARRAANPPPKNRTKRRLRAKDFVEFYPP